MEAFRASVALVKSEGPFSEGSWNLLRNSLFNETCCNAHGMQVLRACLRI